MKIPTEIIKVFWWGSLTFYVVFDVVNMFVYFIIFDTVCLFWLLCLTIPLVSFFCLLGDIITNIYSQQNFTAQPDGGIINVILCNNHLHYLCINQEWIKHTFVGSSLRACSLPRFVRRDISLGLCNPYPEPGLKIEILYY